MGTRLTLEPAQRGCVQLCQNKPEKLQGASAREDNSHSRLPCTEPQQERAAGTLSLLSLCDASRACFLLVRSSQFLGCFAPVIKVIQQVSEVKR